jgi:hypothetical protein
MQYLSISTGKNTVSFGRDIAPLARYNAASDKCCDYAVSFCEIFSSQRLTAFFIEGGYCACLL